MTRCSPTLLTVLLAFGLSGGALAQKKDDKKEEPKPAAGGEETFTVEESTDEKPAEETPPVEEFTVEETVKPVSKEETALAESHVSWQDIVVVKRKPFLKMNRLELTPMVARTLNDNMIKHIAVV